MLNHDKTGLRIFDNFIIDFNLPKWQEKAKNAKDQNEFFRHIPTISRSRRGNGVLLGSSGFISPSSPISIDGGTVMGTSFGVNDSSQKEDKSKQPSLFNKIFGRKKLREEKQRMIDESQKSNFNVVMDLEASEREKIKNETPEITVEEFFKSIKNNKEELIIIEERTKSYEAAIEHLRLSGQEALLENMCDTLEVHRAESQLFALNHKKIISEKNLIEFANKASRELHLDWVKNFTRSIPKKVIDVKSKLDALHIFDNYLVLHYNPDGTGSALTEKEKKDKEDPILFGVILGSQKLYYVGDWMDEYCNLTFDKMVEILGEKAISANDITANVEIPTEK